MAAPTLDECSAFLQRPNAAVNGSTVFGHVSEILLKLVEERPINPVDVFEEVRNFRCLIMQLFDAINSFTDKVSAPLAFTGFRCCEASFLHHHRRSSAC